MKIETFYCEFTKITRHRVILNGEVIGIYLTRAEAWQAFSRYYRRMVSCNC